MLYETIYDFYSSLFVDNVDLVDTNFNIGGYNYNVETWLCHTFSIITLISLVLCLFIFVKWIFKVVSGLIRL